MIEVCSKACLLFKKNKPTLAKKIQKAMKYAYSYEE